MRLCDGRTRIRSLVANLGAANRFTVDHLNEPHNQQLIDKAKIFYTAVNDRCQTSASLLNGQHRASSTRCVLRQWCKSVNMWIRTINYFARIYQRPSSVNSSVIDWWRWCRMWITYSVMKRWVAEGHRRVKFEFGWLSGSEIFCEASIEVRCTYSVVLPVDFIRLLLLDRRCQIHSNGTQWTSKEELATSTCSHHYSRRWSDCTRHR